jgi:hypothetical protein
MNFRSSHLSLAVLLFLGASIQVNAQAKAAWSDWQTLNPDGEEFSVLMPKNFTSDIGKFPYHKMELTGRLYLAAQNPGPVVAVASMSGIKSAPELYTDFQRFNSYVDAFKEWFPEKVRKGTLAKLIPAGTKTFHGHPGREYKVTIGDLSGVAQAYATRKRFYVIVSLNTKTDAALTEKFLSSFVLPERQAIEEKKRVTAENNSPQEAQPNQNATEPNLEQKPAENAAADANPQRANDANGGNEQKNSPNSAANNGANANDPNKKRGPINGGVLNGKAIYMPIPEVPAGDASGVVMVQVLVDEQGTVLEARAVSGPANLHVAAVNAARLARFSPTMLDGEPVRVSGTLSYNFVKSN